MSVTPPKEIDADAEVAQDANDAVDQQGEQGEAGATQEAALYETEVKEQDRWLPIANGTSSTFIQYIHDFSTRRIMQYHDALKLFDSSSRMSLKRPADSEWYCFTPVKRIHLSTTHHQVRSTDFANLSVVARIMKTALPDNAKIAKEAKECMQECVSEFISFITSEGNVQLVLCAREVSSNTVCSC